MKKLSGNCILPFALLGSGPPSHDVLAVEIIDNDYFVTGDSNGQLIVWYVGEDNEMTVKWLLLGHSGSIVVLARVEANDKQRRFVSVSQHREIAVWSCQDGRCLAFERNLQFDHRFIRSYSWKTGVETTESVEQDTGEERLLLCCGQYPGVRLLRLADLQPRGLLLSQAHSNWTVAACVFQHPQAGLHIVLGLGIAGAVTLWTLDPQTTPCRGPADPQFETESKVLQLRSSPLSLHICPDRPRCLLMLCRTEAHVYDAASWSLVCDLGRPPGPDGAGEPSQQDDWAGAVFLGSSCVLLWTGTGNVRMYELPSGLLVGTIGIGSSCSEAGYVSAAGCGRLVRVSTGDDGVQLYLTQSPSALSSSSSSSLAKAWPNADATNRSSCRCICTADHEEQLLLCVGLEDGRVGLAHSPLVILTDDLSSAAAAVSWMPEQHSGPVLCLLAASGCLWSGGHDHSVRLWTLQEPLQCLRELHCHSGPVCRLLQSPPLGSQLQQQTHSSASTIRTAAAAANQINTGLRLVDQSAWPGQFAFVSVSSSGGLVVLSMEQRRAFSPELRLPVRYIGWRPELPALLVQTRDGQTYVVDLAAGGTVDRRESGQLATDLLLDSNCLGVVRLDGGSLLPPLLLQPASLQERLQGSTGPPLQLLSLGPDPPLRGLQLLLVDTETLLVSLSRGQKQQTGGIIESVRLLLSLCQPWGDDSALDRTLETALGLVRNLPLCPGLLHCPSGSLSLDLAVGPGHGEGPGRTERLLAAVAVCQALSSGSSSGSTEVRQVCCLLATSLATVSLPARLQLTDSDTIVVEPLLLRYQSRCLDLRDAARTLLHAGLDDLGPVRRWKLLQAWPQDTESGEGSPSLAVVATAVCGARYGCLGPPLAGESESLQSGRTTAATLMHWLTTRSPHRTGSNLTKRLSLTLLGAGFPVWEPHLDPAALFCRLLETAAGADKILAGWSAGQLLSEEMDVVRSARGALHAVALSRPKVFATCLSIEVLRMQSAASNTVPGTGTAVIGQTPSLPQQQQQQPVLVAARHEVVAVLTVLCERKTRELHEVLPEVVDVLLACLNKLELRQYDLQQLFPPIMMFRPLASHTASGKVSVGTRIGLMVFYDVKAGKYSARQGHKGAVTSVIFSPDGRQVASYSMPDNSVCVWQLSSSGLFGMGSSHSVRLVSTLKVPPVRVAETVTEEDSALLLWLEWAEAKSLNLVTSAGLVNKIKL